MSEATVLDKFKALHFRNLVAQDLHFGEGIHLVSGANGMGKTNLLDAIYYLCLTRSHFSYGDAGALAHGADFFRLEGTFRSGARRERIALVSQARKAKTVERNGVAYQSLAEHVGLLPAVMISPSDVELAVGTPEERRRFVDQTISQYDAQYLAALMTYNRVLKLRNAHLKTAGHPLQVDLTLLQSYDVQLTPPAQIIYSARVGFAETLSEECTAIYGMIAGDKEQPRVAYASKLAERPFNELLLGSRDRDAFLGRTTTGPHRDDLDLTLSDQPLRKFASQGQLKTFVLALRLAQARMLAKRQPHAPILLLDDIFDRLDPARVQQLVDVVVGEHYAQVFVTDTHERRLRRLRIESAEAHYYQMVDGALTGLGAVDN